MFSTDDVREKFLSFMEKRGHSRIPSSSLIPENDKTTLFVSSGMQALIPFLKEGKPHNEGNLLTNSQRCLRVEDIEEVGDSRHSTFFEMLGNWSIGEYWKEKEIPMLFQFLTDKEEGLGIDPKKLFITVFVGDEKFNIPIDMESVELWKKEFLMHKMEAIFTKANLPNFNMKEGERIFAYGAEKNWWSRSGTPENMPIGEIGGSDTEVFFDTGVGEMTHPNDDNGRFVEIGNSVFIEYEKDENGFKKLPIKSVDFGAGLERLVAAVNGYDDIFMVDVFKKYIDTIENKTGKKYDDNKKAFRIIADHLRASSNLIKDGVVPSNTEQGYILRRLIRRSAFQASKLNVPLTEFLSDDEKEASVIIGEEEKLFIEVLEKAVKQFDKKISNNSLTGKDAFELQSSFGLPIEMIKELAETRNIDFSEDDYKVEMEKHRELSRKGSVQKFTGGLAGHSEKEIKYHTATHLLHTALRNVLGQHVTQRGSNITPERLRFDFSHQEKLTEEQKEKVEEEINNEIKKKLPVTCEIMSKEDAIKLGAIGAFGEKYGEKVSVYTIGDDNYIYSREFCGGPHVKNIGELGRFKIIKEESVAKGIRRIRAILE